ncbi:GNAT family N-acetyltransferase [uncultured Lacinutrix sp.]|uniref:GNAT family N-acetyltransferase n=1 Tax=uncultured Lacinutrix sp. TaxID=574032 RepID=UPI002615A051|nr:GNAT family N-acetyltransferase [uncultured Lacinutrix sp.]
MLIIKAEIQHLNDLVPLFDGYRIFYRQISNNDAVKAFLKERLEKRDTIIFIAYIGDKAVGYTQLFHSFSSVAMKPIFILNDLFVDSNYRKKGVGVALMNKAKILCKELEYKGIGLQTETTNPAQHLYESLGWKKDSDLQYFWTNEH